MKKPYLACLVGGSLLLSLAAVTAGCSSKSSEASTMGPMPTAPPAGSPYAAKSSDISPDEFVAKLQAMPAAERGAYLKQHQTTMNAILADPNNTPAKQKLMAIVSQH